MEKVSKYMSYLPFNMGLHVLAEQLRGILIRENY